MPTENITPGRFTSATPNSQSREYKIWCGMIQRCTNPKRTNYKFYGGRGIMVCPEWRLFKNFYADIGPIKEWLSLDRKDVNGNYEPGNVILATKDQQSNNARSNISVSVQGFTGSLKQASRHFKINYQSVYYRVIELGWPHDKALLTPITPPKLRWRARLR